MLKELENELYRLINEIEYYGYSYTDYQEDLDSLEEKIAILKKVEKF